jgi:hypothetical protein
MTVFSDRAGIIDERAVNAALAVIDGLKPQNEIEAMLAAQIAVTHGLTMKFSARLYSGATETIPQQDSAALSLAAARERPSHRRRRSAAMGRTLRRQPSHGRAKRQQTQLRLAVTDRSHLPQGFTFLKARPNQA